MVKVSYYDLSAEPAEVEVPEESRDIEVITTEILYLKNKAGEAILEIGRRLIEAKAQLPHGEWLPWLEGQVGFSTVTAQRFMRLAEEYPNASPVTHLGASKALILLALPPAEREEFLAEKHEVNGEEKTAYEMTRSELREAIRAKEEAEQDRQFAEADKEKAKEELKAMKEAFDRASDTIRGLKADIERLEKEPKNVTAVETVPDKEKEMELESQILHLKTELKNAEKNAKELDAALKSAKEAVTKEKASAKEAADKAAKELEAERSKTEDVRAGLQARIDRLQKSAVSPAVSEFKLYFDQIQDLINKMKDCIDRQDEEDPAVALKLRKASVALMEKSADLFAPESCDDQQPLPGQVSL